MEPAQGLKVGNKTIACFLVLDVILFVLFLYDLYFAITAFAFSVVASASVNIVAQVYGTKIL